MLLPQRVNGSEIVTPAGEGWRSEAAENDAMTKKELKKKKELKYGAKSPHGRHSDFPLLQI